MLDIVVASWNCVTRLIDMVESVRVNSRWPWRMFVVDNASEDGAAEWLSDQRDLHVIFKDENCGFSRATNTGLEHSLRCDDSEWTVLMNNDITVPRHWDKVMLNALAKRPRVKLCSPLLVKMRGRDSLERQRRRAISTYGRNAMVKQDWIGFSCAFANKDVWRKHGLLSCEGDFWHWGSDREFCLRLGDRWRIAMYTGLAVSHWHSASRAYINRRRTGVRASQGLVWRLADEMYASRGQVNTKEIMERIRLAQGYAPTPAEVRYILLLWLERLRIARRRKNE